MFGGWRVGVEVGLGVGFQVVDEWSEPGAYQQSLDGLKGVVAAAGSQSHPRIPSNRISALHHASLQTPHIHPPHYPHPNPMHPNKPIIPTCTAASRVSF